VRLKRSSFVLATTKTEIHQTLWYFFILLNYAAYNLPFHGFFSNDSRYSQSDLLVYVCRRVGRFYVAVRRRAREPRRCCQILARQRRRPDTSYGGILSIYVYVCVSAHNSGTGRSIISKFSE